VFLSVKAEIVSDPLTFALQPVLTLSLLQVVAQCGKRRSRDRGFGTSLHRVAREDAGLERLAGTTNLLLVDLQSVPVLHFELLFVNYASSKQF
jgi:hypothetical protein